MTENKNKSKNEVVGKVNADNSLQKIPTDKSDARRIVVVDEKIILKPTNAVLGRK